MLWQRENEKTRGVYNNAMHTDGQGAVFVLMKASTPSDDIRYLPAGDGESYDYNHKMSEDHATAMYGNSRAPQISVAFAIWSRKRSRRNLLLFADVIFTPFSEALRSLTILTISVRNV